MFALREKASSLRSTAHVLLYQKFSLLPFQDHVLLSLDQYARDYSDVLGEIRSRSLIAIFIPFEDEEVSSLLPSK